MQGVSDDFTSLRDDTRATHPCSGITNVAQRRPLRASRPRRLLAEHRLLTGHSRLRPARLAADSKQRSVFRAQATHAAARAEGRGVFVLDGQAGAGGGAACAHRVGLKWWTWEAGIGGKGEGRKFGKANVQTRCKQISSAHADTIVANELWQDSLELPS